MQLPDWLTTTLAADAVGSTGVPEIDVRPLRMGQRLSDQVTTVRLVEGDNQGLREVLAHGPQLGPVLLVHGSPTSRRAVMGEIVAAALAQRGFTGMITDGLVRDSNDIALLNFPVWARGTCPLASNKGGPCGLNEPLQFGGVPVQPGDYAIADDDGIVIWPSAMCATFLHAADARRQLDVERLRKAQSGLGLS